MYAIRSYYDDEALENIIKAIDMAEFIKDFDGLEFLYNTKGMIYLAQNDLDNAIKSFNTADGKNPYNSISKLNLALIRVLQSTKYNAKNLHFEYVPELLSPRLILPSMKLAKTRITSYNVCYTKLLRAKAEKEKNSRTEEIRNSAFKAAAIMSEQKQEILNRNNFV